MQYLYEGYYYINRYDLHTIEECLDYYFALKNGAEEKRNAKEFQKFTKEEFDKEVHKAVSYTVNVIKIERYRKKTKTIQKWMDEDRKTQEKYDNAIPPRAIFCKECDSPTKVSSKDLLDKDAQVLFMFECIKCKKRQAFYEDGTEWHHEKPRCPTCTHPLTSKSIDKKDVLTTIYSCSNCSYTKKDEYDFKKSKEEREKREARNKKLLDEYRTDFCLSNEEGPAAVESLDNMSRLMDDLKEKEKKEDDPIFQKAKQLKTLKITRLKETIEKTIEAERYKDLQFGKPEMGQFVIIDFTVNDSKDERSQYDSCNTLKKLINAVLEDSNWRLMSEGIHYRLGILSGRLKAYEREEDLMELVK